MFLKIIEFKHQFKR